MMNKKAVVRFSLLILFVFLFSLYSSYVSPVEASNANKELFEIQEKLKTSKQKVEESIKKEKSVIELIEDLNNSIKKKTEELEDYDKRISGTQSEISTLSQEISLLNSKLDSRKKHLKGRLRALYKQQYGGHALVLISARDYQDLIQKSKYISLIAHHDSKVINKYGTDLEEITSKKRKLESLNEELKTNKNIVRKMQKALQTDRIQKDKLLTTIRSTRKSYEKTIAELEKSSKKLLQMIEGLKKKRLPEAVTGKGFRSAMGLLPWPISGKVVIPFGTYKDPEYNITVFKNGIEIKPDKGEIPKAIAGGRVVYADWFKGYGMLLIIDHGSDYHTLYGNLSEIFLNTGDILTEGKDIGKIGISTLLNIPALYFEIRHKGKPVDPMEWLLRKSRTSNKIRIR
ncbi:MAG: peptidoglycan DD-metalloendopeptidase family protein [Nitrospirae bacterium]|nr:peptidoglycan DD-metalloendopeptidase family protein [Nitrospirota bacterium]